MRVKNNEILRAINILDKYGKMKLPQRLSFAITKNLIILNREYKVYDAQLKKIIDSFSDHFVKDDCGDIKTHENGMPVIDDETVNNEMASEILELLNITVDVELYRIDFDVFNYDDNGVYDILTSQDIIALSMILCNEEE